MESNNSGLEPQEKQSIKEALRSSWKAIMALTLLFVGVAILVKLVLVPWHESMSDNPDNPKGYVNNIMINRLSNQLEINKEQALKVFRLYRIWKVQNEVLNNKYDSINLVLEKNKLANDSVACSSVLLELIDFELQINGNTSRFYNSVQEVLTREQTAKMLRIVRDEK